MFKIRCWLPVTEVAGSPVSVVHGLLVVIPIFEPIDCNGSSHRNEPACTMASADKPVTGNRNRQLKPSCQLAASSRNSSPSTRSSKLAAHNSHPFLYSLRKNLFASGMLVISIFAESYNTFFRARSATAPRLMVSEMALA